MVDLQLIPTGTPVTGSDQRDYLVEEQLKLTAQTLPPALNAGAFLIGESYRGPILPQYGTKERDRMLRIYDRYEYNGIWQGARAGLIKKTASTPWEIIGDSPWTKYFQTILQTAALGRGWDVFLKKLLRDYLTQDFGAFIELIGPGRHDGPMLGPVVGINNLDSARCYVTGNPTWPVVYYSLMTGALHKMHHTRIIRLVDMTDPDERYFSIGESALSRCIGAANREIRMGRYVDGFLDDKPKPGITSISGLTQEQFKKIVADYTKNQNKDGGDIFGKTLMLFSLDTDKEIKVQEIPFAQTPEKFDFIKYVDMDVNCIALGLGVDRQELWELGGRMLGSASQSSILAQKAESKAFGDIITNLTKIFNIDILPVGLELVFRSKNTIVDAAQADNDVKLSNAVHIVASIPNVITGLEVRKILANRSKTFSDGFKTDKNTISLTDDDVKSPDQEVRVSGDNTVVSAQGTPSLEILSQPINMLPATPEKPDTTSGSATSDGVGKKTDAELDGTPPSVKKALKEFDDTKGILVNSIIGLVVNADGSTRRNAGIRFRSEYRRLGEQAFKDGLEKGGVYDPLDEDDLFQVQSWLVSQSNDITNFLDNAYSKDLTASEIAHHAKMWANKGLSEIYHEGIMSADKNGSYVWILGPTEKHCPDCGRLEGQVHRFKQWYARGWIPQSDKLDCNGIECKCELQKSTEMSRGRF